MNCESGKSYNINHNNNIPPTLPALTKRTNLPKPFYVVSSSFVRDMKDSFSDFCDKLEEQIENWIPQMEDPKNDMISLAVFPEYFWRVSMPAEVLNYVKTRLFSKMKTLSALNKVTLILGTLEFCVNGKYGNQSIILNCENDEPIIWFVAKTKILQREQEAQMHRGPNPGSIPVNGFNFQVLVCADFWESHLIDPLSDILVIPCWTACAKGSRSSNQLLWRSLGLSRCKEFQTINLVSDHADDYEKTDVAAATSIWNPADRNFQFPNKDKVNEVLMKVDLKELQQARIRWKTKGTALFCHLEE